MFIWNEPNEPLEVTLTVSSINSLLTRFYLLLKLIKTVFRFVRYCHKKKSTCQTVDNIVSFNINQPARSEIMLGLTVTCFIGKVVSKV